MAELEMAKAPEWSLKRKAAGEAAGSDDRDKKTKLETLKTETQALAGKKGGLLLALVAILARLSLTNSRELADLTGACYHCWIVPVGVAPVPIMNEAGKSYSEACKEAGKNTPSARRGRTSFWLCCSIWRRSHRRTRRPP